jgi:hypothetical protein
MTSHNLTLSFSPGREYLAKNNTMVISHPPYSPNLALCNFSVSHHFDAIEMIGAELQAVLNTLANTTFRIHLKMGDALGTVAHSQKATTLRVMMASRSKLGF